MYFKNEIKNCFIIAEAGVNHNGDLDMAKKLCRSAKEIGADAIKFQTWITEDIIFSGVEQAEYQKTESAHSDQFEMLKQLELSFDDFRILQNYCNELGILFLSTPNDIKSARFLHSLNLPFFKTGSDDLDNYPLLKEIAQYDKPMLISTGMSTMNEIQETANFLKFNSNLSFLHCTSSYPTKISNCNLNAIISMKEKLDTTIGYSDHTETTWMSPLAVYLGAQIIEKHLTLDNYLPGPDHKSSLLPEQFEKMVLLINNISELKQKQEKIDNSKICKLLEINLDMMNSALGSFEKKPTKEEFSIMPFVKKSIVTTSDVMKNESFSRTNLSVKRTGGLGLSPRNFFDIINRPAKINIKKNEVLLLEAF
jgi:N,N'-diacetyllegionaminate synthase